MSAFTVTGTDTDVGKTVFAAALTGALKFEVPDSDGAGIEPRGNRAPEKKRTHQNKGPKKGQGAPRQSHPAGKRGRPGNIRHQGRKKK